MKRKLMILVMAAALVLSIPMAVSAAEVGGNGTNPVANAVYDAADGARYVASSDIGATRHSATSGTVSAYAMFSGTASKATCAIYLQELYNGSWRTATGLTTTSYKKTVTNANSITAGKTFTLKSGKTYRAQIVFNDTIGGTTYTKTRYTGSF